MESTAASQGRKRIALKVCLLPTDFTLEVPVAEAVDVAAGVSDWMVNEVVDPVVLMELVGAVNSAKVPNMTPLGVGPFGATSMVFIGMTRLVVGPSGASNVMDLSAVGLKATVSGSALSAIVDVVVDAGVIHRLEEE